MKLMTWTHNAPNSFQFNNYMRKIDGEWQIVDPEAINNFSDTVRNMVDMFEKNNSKISDMGMHEFGVRENGEIYDYRATSVNVLSQDKRVVSWVPTSLQYFMETYPHINYAIQTISFGSKVDYFLHTIGGAVDTFLDHLYHIALNYKERWSVVNTIEIDFEKTHTLNKGDAIYKDGVLQGYAKGDDWEVYADFIKRVKDEVAIPLGMKLRVNMYAMTGDWNPHYYGWHDYKTLASRVDKNGNQAIDEFQLMTYDFSWGGSAPGPSTPVWWLEDVLEHVQDSLPPERTWIGNAGYGRRWPLDQQVMGNALTYNQITQWQNGLYVHSGSGEDGWVWRDQDWLPFAGFNDENSGYQISYLHLYDKFSADQSVTTIQDINRTNYGGFPIVTSYFRKQHPEVKGVQAVLNDPEISGRVSSVYEDGGEVQLGEYFPGANRAENPQYQYDENVDACVKVPDKDGEEGKIEYNFSIANPGRYKLIALVHFNTFDNDVINANLNGQNFSIGGDDLYDWFPFFVDKSAWIEVGEFDFNTNNTLTVGVSKGYIWGFLVCEEFDQNILGGEVGFNTNLQPYFKRDNEGSPVQADMPSEMTVTGEIIRRVPRPAIIFEDNFSHMLNQEEPGYNLASIPYYLAVGNYSNTGSNKVWSNNSDNWICTDNLGIHRRGFSSGAWSLTEDGNVIGNSGQLVLYRRIKANVRMEVSLAITGNRPIAGFRMLATEEGNDKEGYLAVLDYTQNRVVFGYEDGNGNFSEIASSWMQPNVQDSKGSFITMTATIIDNKAYVDVRGTTYINGAELTNRPPSGAYGVYVSGGEMELNLLNISTVDRWETLEKLEVEVDGEFYTYGEVDRGLSYDNYGYLVYTGLDLDQEVTPAPLPPDEVGGSATLDFDLDYRNIPLARHKSWTDEKQVKLRMVDAGIWLRNLYIGDSEGFSVGYNSDYIGFIETTNLINKYNCKGVAMWDIGQEDPLIYTYLPTGGD